MNDIEQTLSDAFALVGREIQKTKEEKGWRTTTPADWEHTLYIPADLMLIVSEVAEALEAFRKNDKAGFELELADIQIRLLGFCEGMNIDLADAVIRKMAVNAQREHRHGGKKI